MGKKEKDDWPEIPRDWDEPEEPKEPEDEPEDDEIDEYEKMFQESDALEKIKTLAVVKRHCKENKISLKEFLLFYMLENLEGCKSSLRGIENNLERVKDYL